MYYHLTTCRPEMEIRKRRNADGCFDYDTEPHSTSDKEEAPVIQGRWKLPRTRSRDEGSGAGTSGDLRGGGGECDGRPSFGWVTGNGSYGWVYRTGPCSDETEQGWLRMS